jgi:REP element-mobilizing transposase RayT
MGEAMAYLHVHAVWATKQRQPLLTGEVGTIVYACVREKCRQMGCTVIAMGGVEDHVHLLARIPSTLPAAELVRGAKGASSRAVTHGRLAAVRLWSRCDGPPRGGPSLDRRGRAWGDVLAATRRRRPIS